MIYVRKLRRQQDTGASQIWPLVTLDPLTVPRKHSNPDIEARFPCHFHFAPPPSELARMSFPNVDEDVPTTHLSEQGYFYREATINF
jgi:hypothetical protein